jgi:hypothetical protein
VFDFLPKDVQVTEKDLADTPPAVLKLLFAMAEEITRLNKQIEGLDAKLGENAVNPNFRTTLLSGICTPNMVFKRDADEKKKKSVFREV